jgi:dTDP-4-amino-4,6-dideoxygalactose transaminase
MAVSTKSIIQMKIPFLHFPSTHLPIKKEMMDAFEAVYDSNWFVLGKQVNAFEEAYAQYNQVNHCVGVSNGLDALHLALKALEIGIGDEVIVPSNTFIATVLAVSYVGATPVFVEPDGKTYNIDPKKIEAKITGKTKAIMPVHLYGQACEMDEIMEIASKHNLYVIEDNAQSQGATFNNKITGSFGHINATSFYPGKNLGALGDSGGITSNDSNLADKARTLANYGTKVKYVNDEIGYNMRMDEIQAAFLKVKLNYLNQWIEERRQIASWYDEHLAPIEQIVLPYTHPSSTHTYHLYVIRTNRRDDLQKHLTEKNIGTLIHYPIPPHLQNAYANLGFAKGSFPIAEEIADTCISLPIWPGMTLDHVIYVSQNIKSFFNP